MDDTDDTDCQDRGHTDKICEICEFRGTRKRVSNKSTDYTDYTDLVRKQQNIPYGKDYFFSRCLAYSHAASRNAPVPKLVTLFWLTTCPGMAFSPMGCTYPTVPSG